MEILQKHRALANRLPVSAAVFADVFRRAQRSREPILVSALRPRHDDERTQHALAFAWAEGQGLLPDLVRDILNRAPTREFAEKARDAGVDIADSGLQAILDPTDPLQNTGLLAQHLPSCAGQICRILVDGTPKGTGFLVAPRVVATAHHVLANLMEWDAAQGRWIGIAGSDHDTDSHDRIQFEFGNSIIEVNGARHRRETQTVLADADWVIDASECHRAERQGGLPDTWGHLQDHYDFVLCRLASIVQVDKRGIEVERNVPLGPADTHITILQHPQGRTLVHDRKEAFGTNRTAYRIDHAVNTDNGSSGAPCLNDNLRVVAMHQAGPENGPAGAPSVGSDPKNRCVPITWMLPALDGLGVPQAGLTPLHVLEDGHRVFGRSALVQWIDQTLSGGAVPPILAVVRYDIPGLRFTVRLMQALLPVETHNVVYFHTDEFDGLDASDALKLLYDRAGIAPHHRAWTGDPLTARPAQIRYHRATDFLEDLNSDDGRTHWFVLDGFAYEAFGGSVGGTRDLFDTLFQRAGADVRLRFVLLRRDPDPALPPNIAQVHTEHLGLPTADEIETYLRLEGSLAPDVTRKQAALSIGTTLYVLHDLPPGDDFYARFEAAWTAFGQ